MRDDINPGATLPDVELPDHTGTKRMYEGMGHTINADEMKSARGRLARLTNENL